MEKVSLSRNDIERLVAELAEKIRTSGFLPEHIAGIAEGGLVPLQLLSREFSSIDTGIIRAHSYNPLSHERGELVIDELPDVDLRGRRVLLVDEIADSGETLKEISMLLRERTGADIVKTAVLVVHASHCATLPDFYVMETEKWVVFPWETEAHA